MSNIIFFTSFLPALWDAISSFMAIYADRSFGRTLGALRKRAIADLNANTVTYLSTREVQLLTQLTRSVEITDQFAADNASVHKPFPTTEVMRYTVLASSKLEGRSITHSSFAKTIRTLPFEHRFSEQFDADADKLRAYADPTDDKVAKLRRWKLSVTRHAFDVLMDKVYVSEVLSNPWRTSSYVLAEVYRGVDTKSIRVSDASYDKGSTLLSDTLKLVSWVENHYLRSLDGLGRALTFADSGEVDALYPRDESGAPIVIDSKRIRTRHWQLGNKELVSTSSNATEPSSQEYLVRLLAYFQRLYDIRSSILTSVRKLDAMHRQVVKVALAQPIDYALAAVKGSAGFTWRDSPTWVLDALFPHILFDRQRATKHGSQHFTLSGGEQIVTPRGLNRYRQDISSLLSRLLESPRCAPKSFIDSFYTTRHAKAQEFIHNQIVGSFSLYYLQVDPVKYGITKKKSWYFAEATRQGENTHIDVLNRAASVIFTRAIRETAPVVISANGRFL